MSLRHYCPKCGLANLYTTSPPIFCGHCAFRFNSTDKLPPEVKTKAVIQSQEKQYDTDDDGKYEVVTSVPDITELEVDLDLPPRRQPLSALCPQLYKEVLAQKIKDSNKKQNIKIKRKTKKS